MPSFIVVEVTISSPPVDMLTRSRNDQLVSLAFVLAFSGLWSIIVLVGVIGLVAVTVYAIRSLRSEDAWEEQVPPRKDDN